MTRIRATHMSRQSGNSGQDMERVTTIWANVRMQATEVKNYQLERSSDGLPEIPNEELVIGILHRIDMARYTSLVKDYLDNERRGITELPEHPAALCKEIKDTQGIRFRGIGGVNLNSVYLTTTDEAMREETDLEHSGRDRGCGRSSRGRGRGQGRGVVVPGIPGPRLEVKAEDKEKVERVLPAKQTQNMSQSSLPISSAGIVGRNATGLQLAQLRLCDLWMPPRMPTLSSLLSRASDQEMKTTSPIHLKIKTWYQCWCQVQIQITNQC